MFFVSFSFYLLMLIKSPFHFSFLFYKFLVSLVGILFLISLGICIPSWACAMESVGSSFRAKQIGNTQPRRYISKLLKVLSELYENLRTKELTQSRYCGLL